MEAAFITILFSCAYAVLLVYEFAPRIIYVYPPSLEMPMYVERHHFAILDLMYQYTYNEMDMYRMDDARRRDFLKYQSYKAFVDQIQKLPGAIVWHERDFKTDPYLHYGEHLITARAKVVQIDDAELFNKAYGNEITRNEYPEQNRYPEIGFNRNSPKQYAGCGPTNANEDGGNRDRESEVRSYPKKDSEPVPRTASGSGKTKTTKKRKPKI